MAFSAKMDEFTKLEIDGSWESVDYSADTLTSALGVSSGQELFMHVESEGQFSYQKRYRTTLGNAQAVTFPLNVAIVNMDMGEVTGITWDYGCFNCGSDSCAKNTYNYKGGTHSDGEAECYMNDADCSSNKCDMVVYVVWSGTDVNGNYLLSQQKRLSNFQLGDVKIKY
mmetsp:Transcript_70035/g.195970  ORF Transcript_70035/g.195970 Transcript_70035/m.195970 type:complete len:169 (+) Transcript_70035:705-1211(+)